jgi:hypothetical protein
MAVTYVTFDDVVENMEVQCDTGAVLSGLVTILQAYRIANAVALATPLSETNINVLIKIITGMVVATGTDLNCYPTGLATSRCFDEDGEFIP